jgi:hypothetical protein
MTAAARPACPPIPVARWTAWPGHRLYSAGAASADDRVTLCDQRQPALIA